MKDSEFAKIVHETKTIVLSAIEKNLEVQYFTFIDDVAQETYFRAFKALQKGKFRGDSAISTWLYAIARNESIRMNQKLRREELKESRAKSMAMESADVSSDVENVIDLQMYINKLPFRYRTVLELVSQGFSEKQISEKLSIRQGTVKSRTSRGKYLIRKMGGA